MADSPSPNADVPPPGAAPGEAAAPGDQPPDSRWWYWVAALPVYYLVGTVVGFVVGVAAFAFALSGGTAMEPGMGPPWGIGVGAAGVFLLVVALAAVGLLLSLAFPLAIYLDADAVVDAGGDWEPDPVLYGLLGAIGVVAQPLQVPLAVYYLYKRHESTGVP